MIRSTCLSLIAALVFFAGCGGETNTDAAGTAKKSAAPPTPSTVKTKMMLDNEYAMLTEVTAGAGTYVPFSGAGDQRTSMPGIIYALTDAHLVLKGESGETPLELKAGTAVTLPEGKKTIDNAGNAEAVFVLIERKAAALPQTKIKGKVIQDVAAAMTKELLKTEYLQVLSVTLPGGAKVPDHDGYPRIIYCLNPYTLRFIEGNKPAVELTYYAGEAHWRDGGIHHEENAGVRDANFLAVNVLK